MGKTIYQTNPSAFSNRIYSKYAHQFSADPRVHFGRCPGLDYTKQYGGYDEHLQFIIWFEKMGRTQWRNRPAQEEVVEANSNYRS